MVLNREVRQIQPIVAQEQLTKKFDDYSEYPNIVLLGDPGAGKTHLFKGIAERDGAQYITARNFINMPVPTNQQTLFIDALDEQRSSSDSDYIVNKLVQKLLSRQQKQKVRFSCRSQDWLADLYLQTFLSYFKQTGGYVVLHLQKLTREEQITILQANDCEQPEEFLHEAEKRSVSEFLDNPQNLLMLAKSIKGDSWPQTKSELFQSATNFLLTEQNSLHTYQDLGKYSSSELELNEQLDRLYTTNPEAAGYGIYLVFWFGAARSFAIPRLEGNIPPPETAQAMEDLLNERVPLDKKDHLSAIVIDVSGGCIVQQQ